MRAKEFLNEVGILGIDGNGAPETVTITIPKKLLNIQAEVKPEEEEESDHSEYRDSETEEEQAATTEKEEDVNFDDQEDELAHIVRLSKGEHRTPPAGQNHTIAAPAGDEMPEEPLFISPLQQQLELQKQQGGKESPIINQIINDEDTGSTAGEQPEQSVYHDSPLKDNEWVGAGSGSVDNLRNRTTTTGATKPWYKL